MAIANPGRAARERRGTARHPMRRYLARRHERRNPSGAQGAVGAIAALGLAGVLFYAITQWLPPLFHGMVQPGTSPAGTPGGPPVPASGPGATGGHGGGNPSAGWTAMALYDLGSVPLEHMGARVRQSARWIAQYAPGMPDNEYAPGATFKDGSGAIWQWTGGTTLFQPDSGATGNLSDFNA
jgi:hypothetical protein